MEQGLWTAIFSSGSVAGGGVVYLSDGKLIGGDSQYYYIGTYRFNAATLHLEADITVMPFVAGAISVFGFQVARYDLKLSGALTSSEATVVGTLPLAPQLRLNVKLVKRLDGKL
jgi:hypothetical protein